LAKLFIREHVRDGKGNCAACADFTTIAYPCPLAQMALKSLSPIARSLAVGSLSRWMHRG
jgi:hypothetical protein